MRFLLTNDDGVHADGLLALKKALETMAEVVVVAPERQRSGVGHAITMNEPLRLMETKLLDGSSAYACSGTPADSVTLGTLEVMAGDVDLVVSGINHGPNLGWDVHYSGTVSAALEAVMIGHPALAVSLATFADDTHWETASAVTMRVVSWLMKNPMPSHTLLNVNVPNLPLNEIQGMSFTRQGPRQYVDRLEKRKDPTGKTYYWLSGTIADHHTAEDTDVTAVADGRVAITPLHLDLTDRSMYKALIGEKISIE
jgi:5'-nucleotidase